MSELWLLRHAEPEGAGLYIGRGSDPELSPRGKADADRIAAVLGSGETIPEVICSSHQIRALQTVQPLSVRLHTRIDVREGLAEIDFGDWEGLSWREIEQEDGELWKAWLDDPFRTAPPGGETLVDLQDRVIRELEVIMEKYRGSRVLIATHGGPLRTVLGYALGLEPRAWRNVSIDYGALCRFSFRDRNNLSLMQWNVPVRENATENPSEL